MKNPLALSSLGILFSLAMTAHGGVGTGEYEVQALDLPNGTHITVLKPVERPMTVAVAPHGRVWRHRIWGEEPAPVVVHHAHAANGGDVSFPGPE